MYRYLIGAAALVAIPVYAQMGPGPMEPKTREELKQQVAKHFAEMDTNHDGVVTREEAAAFRDKMRSEMRDKAFARMDVNHDGKLSREEFDAGPGGKHRGGPGGPGDHGDRMFDRMDQKHDGRVTLEEATNVALAHFDKIDTNHDGVISPEERKAAFRARGHHHGPKGPLPEGDAPPPPPPGN